MLQKTRGVVFQCTRFRETSVVVKIYTEKFGLRAYLVNGVRAAKPRWNPAFFQPLTLLDLVVYERPHASLNRLSEIRCAYNHRTIPFDYRKLCLASFITEIMLRSIREEEENTALFAFLYDAIWLLDQTSGNEIKEFHTTFMLRLAAYLGFQPLSGFDMLIHVFSPLSAYQEKNLVAYIEDKLHNGFTTMPITDELRSVLLDALVLFYQEHVLHFGSLVSLGVLRSLD